MSANLRSLVLYGVVALLLVAAGHAFRTFYGTHYALCNMEVGIAEEQHRELILITAHCAKGECEAAGVSTGLSYAGGSSGGYAAPDDACIELSRREVERLQQ